MLFGKKCPKCQFPFVQTSKPHKDQVQICPTCGENVSLADAQELPEEQPAPKKTTKEV